MKKNFIFVLIMLLSFSLSSNAQGNLAKQRTRTVQSGEKDKHFTCGFGVKAGATFTTLQGTPNEGELFDKSGVGFLGGIFANFRFGQSKNFSNSGTGPLGVQVEAVYKQLKAKTLGDDDLTLNYFEVPVMLQYYPCYNVKKMQNLRIEAGPVIAGTMGSKPDVLTNGSSTYKTGDLKGFDVRLAFGVGYEMNNGLGINARYNIGMSDLAENFPVKTNTFEISLSFKISGKKLGLGNKFE